MVLYLVTIISISLQQTKNDAQEIDRSVLWIKGREKAGVFLKESTQKCAEKIVSCILEVMVEQVCILKYRFIFYPLPVSLKHISTNLCIPC